jgi:beta-glucanase (GH16 family)
MRADSTTARRSRPAGRRSWGLAVASVVAALVVTGAGVPATAAGAVTSTDRSVSVTPARTRPAYVPAAWGEVFADEFTGSRLDTSRWSTGWFGTGVTGPVNPFEPACLDPRQVQLPGDGTLTLALVARPQRCAGRQRPWSTGLVSSNGKFAYAYGASEARIFLPSDGHGKLLDWPAFWADGQHWPQDGENDVMEVLGGSVAAHFHSTAGAPGVTVPGSWAGWHTFGSVWEPGRVTYVYDGREVGTLTTGITGSPMYLVLNLAPALDGTTVPARMKIDYVRVWQR